jgi:hypothetical protein
MKKLITLLALAGCGAPPLCLTVDWSACQASVVSYEGTCEAGTTVRLAPGAPVACDDGRWRLEAGVGLGKSDPAYRGHLTAELDGQVVELQVVTTCPEVSTQQLVACAVSK